MNVTLSGDTMLLVELEQTIDPSVNQQVIALAQRLDQRLGRLVRDIVPSYCAVGIHFDPLTTDLAALERIVEEEWRQVDRDHVPSPGPPLEIEVRYGGDDGPDLEAVAQWAGCSPASVIEWHSSRTYRVYMLGFVPGFCYMGRVDRRIAAPRRS